MVPETEFDLLVARIDDGFSGVHRVMKEQSSRLDSIDAHLRTLNGRVGKSEDRLLAAERRLDASGVRAARSDGRMDLVKPLLKVLVQPAAWKVVLVVLALYVGVDKLPAVAQTLVGHTP